MQTPFLGKFVFNQCVSDNPPEVSMAPIRVSLPYLEGTAFHCVCKQLLIHVTQC